MTVEKVAIITAGGSGMGAAAVRRLSADGFKVAVLSPSGRGEALANELGGVGVSGSNQSNEDLKRLVDRTMERWGRIDVLVNSAGHGPRAPLLEITDDDWHKAFDVYFMNVVRPTRLVAPIMVEQNGGSIINISTLFAYEPHLGFPTSSVVRVGLSAYAKLFSEQFGPNNVRMNNILCGRIDSVPDSEERRRGIPMKRIGTMQEVAATVSFLASEGAAYFNGESLKMDGGLSRSL
ncbi:MAG: SDR family oxidoreductase [Reyranellaceae bacterium]